MNPQGTPIWYELTVADPDAAERFYAPLVGWRVESAGMDGIDYRLISDDAGNAGALMAPPDPAMPTGWHVYFGVDDVDASVARLRDLGGTAFAEPTDIPGVGRFAFVADPQGARFYLMRGASEEDSDVFSETAMGRCAWNELATTDQDDALAFYSALLGFERAGAMPMGEMGDYSFLTTSGRPLGAMMTTPPGVAPGWMFYFRVPDVDAAKATWEAGGGTIRHGPVEVPGGDHVLMGSDPQGARLGLVGARADRA